jgi:hypothetical protein
MPIKIVKKIKEKGYPVNSKEYKEAHAEADQQEKKRYAKGYLRLKKIEKKMSPNTLMGTHTKKGEKKIAKIVPKSLRKEVAYHEDVEFKNDKRLKREKNK